MLFAHMHPQRISGVKKFITISTRIINGTIFEMLGLYVTEDLVPAGGRELAEDTHEPQLPRIPAYISIDFSLTSRDQIWKDFILMIWTILEHLIKTGIVPRSNRS